MYRGSSFLVQKDYKVHRAAIIELLQEEYDVLWAIKCEEYLNVSAKLDKLFVLSNRLKEIYAEVRIAAYNSMQRSVPAQPVSDTLITKILMGTLGCAPAYDRFFNNGVKASGVSTAQFNKNSIHRLPEYYVKRREVFEDWRNYISSEGIEYPQMKVLDMCFWQIGYDLDRK